MIGQSDAGAASTDLVVYTLVEGDYVAGVAALVNSLRANGHLGEVRIGITGPSLDGKISGAGVRTVSIGASHWWIGNRRAEFILAHPAERFVYIDADVVVRDGRLFTRLASWLDRGPVFAVEGLLPASDFRRLAWRARLGRRQANSSQDCYFNSGFFAGTLTRDRDLLENWDAALRKTLAPPGALFEDPDFPMADQDILNAVLQDLDGAMVALSPPDVWYAASPLQPFFHVGGFTEPAIAHCTGRTKPWRLSRVPPRAPNLYERDWYRYVFEKPTPIKLEDLKLPRSLHSWFRHRPIGRSIERFHRLRQRLGLRS